MELNGLDSRNYKHDIESAIRYLFRVKFKINMRAWIITMHSTLKKDGDEKDCSEKIRTIGNVKYTPNQKRGG